MFLFFFNQTKKTHENELNGIFLNKRGQKLREHIFQCKSIGFCISLPDESSGPFGGFSCWDTSLNSTTEDASSFEAACSETID